MAKIIDLNNEQVVIAEDSGKIIRVPIAMVKYSSPRVNDRVQVFQDGKNYIVTRIDESIKDSARNINKNVFVWVGCLLFGWAGADRHMRGQHGLGIFKLFVTCLIPILCMIVFVMVILAIPTSSLNCSKKYHSTTSHDYYDYDYEYGYSYDCDLDDEFSDQIFENNLFATMCCSILLTIVSSMVGGVWCLVDWIISLTKAYGSNNHSDKIYFDEQGHYLD